MRLLTSITVIMAIYMSLVQQAKAVDWIHMNTNDGVLYTYAIAIPMGVYQMPFSSTEYRL